MGVNAAAFVRHWLRADRNTLGNLLPPVLGFLDLRLHLVAAERPAKVVGAIWMAAGILYGAIKTRGFRGELVNFDLPPEE